MAGTSFTSGFDVVVQINARNFEGIVELRLRPLLSLVGSLGLENPSTGAPIGSLTFTGAPVVRFYLGSAPGMQFEFELVLPGAAYVLTGQTPIPLGPGRSTLAVPTTIRRVPHTPPPPPPPDPPDPGQTFIDLVVEFNWASASFVPFDGGGLASAGISASTVARQLASALRRLLSSQVVVAPALPLITDGRPDPVGALSMRDFQPGIVRAPPGSGNADVFAFGMSFLLGTAGNISALRSATLTDDGAIIISNALIFNRVSTSLSQSPPAGLGIPVSAFSVTPAGAPNTLAITPGTRITVNGTSLAITNFTLVALSNTLTLTSHYQFEVPPGVAFDVDVNGPVNFALARGGTLVVGAVLTNSVTYHISVAGGVLIVLAAALAAVITVASYGTAAAPVVAIAAGTAATAVTVALAFINGLVGEIGRLLGPTFQTSIEAAFSGAGGGGLIPPGLLSLLGGSVSLTPPLIFDDFSVGASFPGMSAVPELRRVDAIAVQPGAGIDLDNNSVIPASAVSSTPGIDLLWATEGYPVLRAQTDAKLIRVTLNFDELTEAQLERFVVGMSHSIDGSAIPVVPATGTIPDPAVLGVRTGEHRYAKVAVWKDPYGRLIMRYVIYDNLAPSVRIQRSRPVWQVISSVRAADTPGTWLTSPMRNFRVSNQGVFRAVCHRAVTPVTYSWSLGGFSLSGAGSVTVSGSPVSFVVSGDSCILTTGVGADLDAELVCAARDATGTELADRLQLAARGTQSIPYGRSGLQSRLDLLNQFVVTRIEDIRPDPPPEPQIRVERDRLVVLASGTGTTPSALNLVSLADAGTVLGRVISESGGPQLPNLRLR